MLDFTGIIIKGEPAAVPFSRSGISLTHTRGAEIAIALTAKDPQP